MRVLNESHTDYIITNWNPTDHNLNVFYETVKGLTDSTNHLLSGLKGDTNFGGDILGTINNMTMYVGIFICLLHVIKQVLPYRNYFLVLTALGPIFDTPRHKLAVFKLTVNFQKPWPFDAVITLEARNSRHFQGWWFISKYRKTTFKISLKIQNV